MTCGGGIGGLGRALKWKVDERGWAEAEGEGVCEIKRKRKKQGRTDGKVPAARRFLWLTLLHPSHRAGKQKKNKTTGSFATTGVRIPKPQTLILLKKNKQTNKAFICATEGFAPSCSNAEVRLKTICVDASKEDVELGGVREETAEDEMEAGDWPWPTLKETREKNCRNQFGSQDQLSLNLLQKITGNTMFFEMLYIPRTAKLLKRSQPVCPVWQNEAKAKELHSKKNSLKKCRC